MTRGPIGVNDVINMVFTLDTKENTILTTKIRYLFLREAMPVSAPA